MEGNLWVLSTDIGLTCQEMGKAHSKMCGSWKTCQHWLQTSLLWLLDHSKNLTVKCAGNVVVRLVGEGTELL